MCDTGYAEIAPDVCAAARNAWADSDPLGKFGAIHALGRLETPSAYELMWDVALTDGYSVEWELVEVLAASGATAYETLDDRIQTLIEDGWAQLTEPDEKHYIPRLSTVAKFLPGLVDCARASQAASAANAARTLDHLIALIAAMGTHGKGLGVEASLAQGFKQAALRYADVEYAREAADQLAGLAKPLICLISRAQFWYSRVVALHALARLTVAVDGCMPGHRIAADLRETAHRHLNDRHPFVSATSRLVLGATDKGETTAHV